MAVDQRTVVTDANGGTGSQPAGWSLIEHLLTYTWPDGHQDQLRTAGAAWQAAASSITAQSGELANACSFVGLQQSPEVPLIQNALNTLQTQAGDIAAGCSGLSDACNQYAGHLDQAHHQIAAELESLLKFTALTQGAGMLLGVITAGSTEALAMAADAARLAATAGRVGAILADLIDSALLLVAKIGAVVEHVTTTADQLKGFLSATKAAAAEHAVTAVPLLGRVLKTGKDLEEFDGTVIEATSGTKGNWNTLLKDLRPSTTYRVDGGKFVYQTDETGQVTTSSAYLDSTLTKDEITARRYQGAQRRAGGIDRLPDDQGGHIWAAQFGGPGEPVNLQAMARMLNQSGQGSYLEMEQIWNRAIGNGGHVDAIMNITRAADSTRASEFEVTYRINDGKPVTRLFKQ